MYTYNLSSEEKEYLSGYSIEKFERPSLATDIVVFSVMKEGEQDNSRKRPDKSLKILLVKRATPPFKNKWALPGGFCRPDEDVQETAQRELYEETGISGCYLKLAGTFGEKGRDPRGWIVSNTYLSLVNGADYRIRSGSDAWEAKWFSIDLQERAVRNETSELVKEYELSLRNEEDGVVLQAKILEKQCFLNYHSTPVHIITESNGIGFDHAKIILSCILKLRKEAVLDPTLLFDLVPEYFALTDLQRVFELVLGKSLTKPNFRRKIADLVEETPYKEDGDGAHRPAQLFRRNFRFVYN